jgi:hypothetical protein
MASVTQRSATTWQYRADILAACNCDWGCPCNFNARPTLGFCEGGWALKINEGRCGDVSLNGVGFAFMAKWPRAIHEGQGTGKIWIDNSTSPEQRQAIENILKGRLGGPPWIIFAATIDRWLDIGVTPLQWELNGARSRLNFGDVLRINMEPMRNAVSGKETPAKIVLPEGLVCKELNMTSSQTFSVFTPGMKYAWAGKMVWYGTVDHKS